MHRIHSLPLPGSGRPNSKDLLIIDLNPWSRSCSTEKYIINSNHRKLITQIENYLCYNQRYDVFILLIIDAAKSPHGSRNIKLLGKKEIHF